MADFLDLPTLIIIVVAIVILWRLRSVLGTRTGNERPPIDRIRTANDRTAKADKPVAEADDTVVPLRPRTDAPGRPNLDPDRQALKLEAEIERFANGNADLVKGLNEIAAADPAFSPKQFLEGAKSAYEMIVTAFAAGDRKSLKMLLDKDVYDGFDAVIAGREAEGQTVSFTFVGLPKIEISDAGVDRRIAEITIRFNAEIVSATYDAEKNLIEGDAEQVQTIADEWTFARNTRSRDPNWKLVATNQLD